MQKENRLDHWYYFIILVAISRLYLRVHWLSDIIGAVLFSVIIVYLYTEGNNGIK